MLFLFSLVPLLPRALLFSVLLQPSSPPLKVSLALRAYRGQGGPMVSGHSGGRSASMFLQVAISAAHKAAVQESAASTRTRAFGVIVRGFPVGPLSALLWRCCSSRLPRGCGSVQLWQRAVAEEGAEGRKPVGGGQLGTCSALVLPLSLPLWTECRELADYGCMRSAWHERRAHGGTRPRAVRGLSVEKSKRRPRHDSSDDKPLIFICKRVRLEGDNTPKPWLGLALFFRGRQNRRPSNLHSSVSQ